MRRRPKLEALHRRRQSNQAGIEKFFPAYHFPVEHLGANRTKLGLKSVSGNIYLFEAEKAPIEPSWD